MPKNILKKKRITIREYQPEDKDRVINLLNAPSIKPDIWEWQFDKRYYSSSIKPIIAEDNWGNILGFNGMMPIKLHTQRFGELEAAWSCDFFVSRHCRGLGVGKEIKRELKKQSPITFALGTSPTAAIVLKRSGWTPYNRVYSYSGKPKRLAASPSLTFNAATDILDSHEIPEAHQIDQLWKASKSNYKTTVVRDSSYMNWRYKNSPIARYHYLSHYKGKDLHFLAVYFEGERFISLVDYIGPQDDETLDQIIDLLARKKPELRCTTSSAAWERAFTKAGLSKSTTPSNCFIYTEEPALSESIAQSFYIMPGDCDGEFLGSSVAHANLADVLVKPNYQVQEISFQAFLKLEHEWDALLLNSDNPTLFLTWDWIRLWWAHFADNNNFELKLLLCRQNGILTGIAPMYIRQYRQFKIFPVTQLQLIGCSWSGPNTFRSEYLDLIIHREHALQARLALLDHIFDTLKWDELVLGDIPHQSLTTRLIEESYGHRGVYPRLVHEDHSVIVDCNTKREAYIANLSSNFRRTTIMKNEKLCREKEVTIASYKQRAQCPFDIIETINKMHLPRWGKPCFEGQHKAFHEALINQFSKRNKLNIGSMELNDRIAAISYNLTFNGTAYNIQLGYDEAAEKGYALGFIHLMNDILRCIDNPKITAFDLLAGYGKNDFYKERFGGRIQNVKTKQYLRGKWIKLIYRIYDKKQDLQ